MASQHSGQRRARLLVTPGEPAGIGPDVLLQWFNSQSGREQTDIIAIADPDLLMSRAEQLRLDTPLHVLDKDHGMACHAGQLNILPIAVSAPATAGELNPANAAYVIECLRTAATQCLAGQAEGIVTGPVQKSVINDAGIPFTGHTEYFAEACSPSVEPVMMLATPGLRVALVTTHLPLRQVADQVTSDKLEYCLHVLHNSLKDDFGIPDPHILVAGLNPHAGEQGHLGQEETDIITPSISKLQEQGMHLTGPLPADTLFTAKYLSDADAVLAMYHDQGLPVLKHIGFGQAVNITLGLPILRTSVDHGTALDLAGTGRADAGSLTYAIEIASQLAQRRLTNRNAA